MPQTLFRAKRLVLHIPHSSPVFPCGYNYWSNGIDDHIARWTDWYTDWIFCSAAMGDVRIVPVIFPFSRFFCDVERLENDPLESIGQGIIYTDFGKCHRRLKYDERKTLLERYYHPHMDRLRCNLHPSAFLLDCHSFPYDLSEVDVCIGYNDDWSQPEAEIITQTESIFKDQGFKTGLNHPYSNSLSPTMPFSYPSMMIELNKKTYMSEYGELDYVKMQNVVNSLRRVFSLILDGDI